jgi:hypothetical protein
MENEWRATNMWNHNLSNSRGVAILFSKIIDYEEAETGRNNTGRKISLAVKIPFYDTSKTPHSVLCRLLYH